MKSEDIFLNCYINNIWHYIVYLGDAGDESESETETAGPGGEEGNVDGENEETTAAAEESTTKPTTKNPMCQYNPSLPMCKQ